MGQRHQTYIFYHDGRDKESKIKCIAFHDQWCYGTLPLRNLSRFMKFQKRAGQYHKISSSSCFTDGEEKFRALLALDMEAGVHSGVHNITSDVTNNDGWIDPDRGDNNDGITLMYFPKDGRVKYCLIGLSRSNTSRHSKNGERYNRHEKKPLTARQYVELYYHEGTTEWRKYGIKGLLKVIEKGADVLTLQECFALLPDWYAPQIEAEKIKGASEDELLLFVNCLPENKDILERRLKNGGKGSDSMHG